MYDKDFYRDCEEWSFLERFKGYNIELNREILNAAEEQGIDVRKVFGKAISNMLKNGKETRNILQYAVDCFSIAEDKGTEDVQLFGTEEPVGCWYRKAYLVELGEDFWQIEFASSVGEHRESIVNYSKVRLDRNDIKFHEDTGEVLSWIKPVVGQMMDIKQLRGI